MKRSFAVAFATTALLCTVAVNAFPVVASGFSNGFAELQRHAFEESFKRGEPLGGSGVYEFVKRSNVRQPSGPSFDPLQQHVDVTEEHSFVAPDFANGDIRGPCPGLNALANHNFIPHNGVGTIQQFIDATAKLGMGEDLASFLAVLGATMAGDGSSWSIGGAPISQLSQPIQKLMGTPLALAGSHNKFEADSSPTRGDLYEHGNGHLLQMSQFTELYALQQDSVEPNYDINVLMEFRSRRFDQSIAKNPYFYNGAFTGTTFSTAVYAFIYRLMANHTMEHPEGILSKDVLKSWFAVSGPDDNLVYTVGHERIPNDWYRRSVNDPYTFSSLQADVQSFALAYPKLAQVGGNIAGPNTFRAANIATLTGGFVTTSNTLLEGNRLVCLGLQAAKLGQPDLLSVATALLERVEQAASWAMEELDCGDMGMVAVDERPLRAYPGWTKLRAGGVYSYDLR